MKKIKEQIRLLLVANAKTNWTKGVFFALFACFIIFALANVYLLFRPISKDVKEIIDQEVNSANLNFDQKTIDTIKKRQEPNTVITVPVGKNPFTPL
jgi:hypothetical protein